MTLRESAIELCVEAACLARTSFPRIVDPLVATLSIETLPCDDLYPHVAYDASLGVYAVCYEWTFSATDRRSRPRPRRHWEYAE